MAFGLAVMMLACQLGVLDSDFWLKFLIPAFCYPRCWEAAGDALRSWPLPHVCETWTELLVSGFGPTQPLVQQAVESESVNESSLFLLHLLLKERK